MKLVGWVLALGLLASGAQAAEIDGWRAQAERISITRDDWGIVHVHGKSDADAVFGMAYAQAEDDFNRVETNYINGMGRLAESEGAAEIYRDLRMKLYIDPDSMKAKYTTSPERLKRNITMGSWNTRPMTRHSCATVLKYALMLIRGCTCAVP